MIEQELASRGGPFFLGEQLSMADISIIPIFERMDASLTFNEGFRMRGEGKKDLTVYDHIFFCFSQESTRVWKHGSPPWKPDQHT